MSRLTPQGSAALCAMSTFDWPHGRTALGQLVLRFMVEDATIAKLLGAIERGMTNVTHTRRVHEQLRAELESCLPADDESAWRWTARTVVDLFLLMCAAFVDGDALVVAAVEHAYADNLGALKTYIYRLVPLDAPELYVAPMHRPVD